jgi:hypothetical protein
MRTSSSVRRTIGKNNGGKDPKKFPPNYVGLKVESTQELVYFQVLSSPHKQDALLPPPPVKREKREASTFP